METRFRKLMDYVSLRLSDTPGKIKWGKDKPYPKILSLYSATEESFLGSNSTYK